MGVLSQVWSVANEAQRGDLSTLARQLETLARGEGFTRPDSISAPSTWSATDPSTRVESWEGWYNGGPAAGAAGASPACPPTSVIQQQTDTSPAEWPALVALAAGRNVPAAVRAYLTVQNATWQSFAPHWTTTDQHRAMLANAERALQAWWFARLGGQSGTPAAWPTGSSTSSSSSGGMSDGAKALAAAVGLFFAAKFLRRR